MNIKKALDSHSPDIWSSILFSDDGDSSQFIYSKLFKMYGINTAGNKSQNGNKSQKSCPTNSRCEKCRKKNLPTICIPHSSTTKKSWQFLIGW